MPTITLRETTDEKPAFIDHGSQERDGSYLLVWRSPSDGIYLLTRFVYGMETVSCKFPTIEEAYHAAEMCNVMAAIDIDIETLLPFRPDEGSGEPSKRLGGGKQSCHVRVVDDDDGRCGPLPWA